jgi:pimeloyl-ACP methyl ester carboxylesterase
MPEVTVGSVPFWYEEAGEGPPLLLVHGILGTGRLHLRHQCADFSTRFRAVLPDLQGYGQSGGVRDTSPRFYEHDAEDLAGLIEALGLGAVHCFGFSDGGLSGLFLAAARPQLVRSLVVLGVQRRLLPEDRAGWEAMRHPETWDPAVQERTDAAHPGKDWRAISRALPPA